MLARTDFLDFALIGTGPREAFWLQRSLGEHPSIAFAKGTSPALGQKGFGHGRLSFQSGELEKWRSRFVDAGPLTVLGAIDPDLAVDPTAATRLAQAFPSLKVVAFLRDPVELLLDIYHWEAQQRSVPSRLIDAIESHPQWLDRTRYHRHLIPFLDRFHPDQICLVIYERFFSQETANLQRLCQYLGVDGEFRPTSLAVDDPWRLEGEKSLSRQGRNLAAKLFARSQEPLQAAIDEQTRWYVLEHLDGELGRLEKALSINLDIWRGEVAEQSTELPERDNVIPLPTGKERRHRLANRRSFESVTR